MLAKALPQQEREDFRLEDQRDFSQQSSAQVSMAARTESSFAETKPLQARHHTSS